ncbi:MAG TPA: HNH endonuclease family protein, partial [Chthoniobacter sp.]|nr:HNH endonuclease family protein [Chthoniobacter sp.]
NLISEIQSGDAPDQMEQFKFSDDDIEEFREALDGDIYDLTPRRRNYLILRLDSFISDGAATYDPTVLTIEHVLPQTVSSDSEWNEWWPDEGERKAWVHRLANLVPLNKKKNSSAQNYEFRLKCKIYFSGATNVSSYALTSQVINCIKWTPEVVKTRQEMLLRALFDNWGFPRD